MVRQAGWPAELHDFIRTAQGLQVGSCPRLCTLQPTFTASHFITVGVSARRAAVQLPTLQLLPT